MSLANHTPYECKIKIHLQLTTIRAIMHPKPSELGSQAGVGLPSTAEGDHAGTLGVVSFLFFLIKRGTTREQQGLELRNLGLGLGLF